MRTFGNLATILALGLAIPQLSTPSYAQTAQSDVASTSSPQTFGAASPFELGDLPPGRLREHIEGLSPAARQRALDWLHRFDFTEADLAYLRVDPTGGVFYEDPVVADSNVETEGAGGESALPEEITQTVAFTLHSRPGAGRTVYLDMDGHVVTGTIWNGSADPLYMRPYDTNGEDGVFTASELNDIAETWKRLAEDFAPYDIDVTTEEPPSFGPNVGHILVTRKADQYGNPIYTCNCGGVAYVGVWGRSNYTYYQPALVFLDGVGGPHNISEAGAHELGHNLKLSHDATSTVGYYRGHGSGNTDWGPIMGVGYYAQVSQWSQGEYLDANNTQDDLDIIRGYLGYRIDDHEDVDFALAAPLTVTADTEVVATNPVTDPTNLNPANKGVIEDRSDVDLFYVDTGAGTIDLTITPAWVAVYASSSRRGMNLDIEATLYDEFGTQIAQDDPTDDTFARITVAVAAGRYILAIDGVGVGDPLTNGYTDYGSIGQYFINGTVPSAVVVTNPPTAPADLAAAADGDASILLSWTDPAADPESNEDEYRVYRDTDGGGFVQIATLPRNTESYADNNLISGSYSYQVQVRNGIGDDLSNVSGAVMISVPVTAHATGESSIDGSIQAGSYIDTHAGSGTETLAEEHTGGKPSSRISKFEHLWTITGVMPGAQVTLKFEAEAEGNTDGDDIQFSYAINAGGYVDLPLLSNGTGRQTLTTDLPPMTSGTVTLHAMDTDRTVGNGSTQILWVHRIEIASSGDPGDQPPVVAIAAPGDGFSADAGEDIIFSASATDPEDGNISGAISWGSNLDGPLGGSASITLGTLSIGQHVITAAVTDSAANAGSDTIDVIITDPTANQPPVVEITAPGDGTSVTQGDSVNFIGTAADPEQGELSANLAWTSNLDGAVGGGASFATDALSVGSHTITATATDGSGLGGSDVIALTVSAAPSGLTADGLSDGPSCGPGNVVARSAAGSGTVTLCGAGFVAGAAISFEAGSGSTPTAGNVIVANASSLSFALTTKKGRKQTRVWNVRVTNPGGASAVCTGCLVITP